MKLPDKLTWDRAAEGHSLIPFDIVKLQSGTTKGHWCRSFYDSKILAFFYCPLCGRQLALTRELWTIGQRGLVWPTIYYLEKIADNKNAPTCLNDVACECSYPNCTFRGVIQLVGWQPQS